MLSPAEINKSALLVWCTILLLGSDAPVASGSSLLIPVENNADGTQTASCAMGARPGSKLPKTLDLRTFLLLGNPPMIIIDKTRANNDTDTSRLDLDSPHLRGFMPDAMREIRRIALEADNVTLTFDLDPVPISFEENTYQITLDMVAIDCNETSNPVPWEDCNRYDLLVGDYWPNIGDRSLKTLFTPPILETGSALIRRMPKEHQNQRPVKSLDAAQALGAPVCMQSGDLSLFFQATLQQLYPDLNITTHSCDTYDECLELLKDPDKCALFLGEKLMNEFSGMADAELVITSENLFKQYIVWAFHSRLDPKIQFHFRKWIYRAKETGFLDRLYQDYFTLGFCPLGKAGVNCDLPCNPDYGFSNREGVCICDSTKWTGEDCSVEVTEDLNLISPGIKIASLVMVGMNFTAVVICAIWLYLKRETSQVKVAQPIFLSLVLLGCLISTSTILAMMYQEDSADGPVQACMLVPWLYSVGFSITFGTLFAKIRRVYVLFQAAAQFQRIRVTTTETLLIVGGILAVDVIILSVWTIVDPLHWNREVLTADKYGTSLSSVGYCVSDDWVAFAGAIAGYHFMLMTVACCMCYVSRHLPTLFSEGKYLTIAMISNLQIFVVALPVLVIVGSDSQTSFFVRSVVIWMNDLAVLVLIFSNLMRSVHRKDAITEGMSRAEMLQTALRSYQDKQSGISRDSGRNNDSSSHG